MEFARPHRLEDGVASRSKIRILDELPPQTGQGGQWPVGPPGPQDSGSGAGTAGTSAATGGSAAAAPGNDEGKDTATAAATDKDGAKADLDAMLLDAANRAAKDLFLGPPLTKPRPHPSVQSQLSSDNKSAAAATTAATEANPTEEKQPEKQKNDVKKGSRGLSRVANNAESDDNLSLQEKRRLRLADSRLYPERCIAPSQIINPHSLVVIFESFDSLSFAYATPGKIFSNRNGHFAHDDFMGKPYGCKIRSRSQGGLGYVYLLRPTPELWTRSLPHRTQIIHELDAAIIVCQLNLRPNCVVCESGTGSGSMSHSVLRTIAPRGKLHTFEFNKERVEAARKEFVKNGVSHLVDVHWRDVCGKNDEEVGSSSAAVGNKDNGTAKGAKKDQTRVEKGGFGLGHAKAHAIFLDLPEPWLAVPHAAHTIVPGGRIGSYSPCIEQSQKLVAAIGKYGFHSVRTIEVRLREHYVDEVELEPPPLGRLPRDPPTVAPGATSASPVAAAAAAAAAGGGASGGGNAEANNAPSSKKPAAHRVPSTVSGNTSTAADFSGEDTGAEADTERSEAETEGEPQRADALVAAARSAQEHWSGLAPMVKKGRNGGGHRVAWDDNGNGQPYHHGNGGNGWSGAAAAYDGTKKRKLLIARPFATMRGHTAFLTFATAGNKKYPDPNDSDGLGP